MATSPTKPEVDLNVASPKGVGTPKASYAGRQVAENDALQALLAFSSLHEQIRQRRAREALTGRSASSWTESPDQFVLYEVLQLVAERAMALTGADGVAIALVQEGEIVCRAAIGAIAPDIGARLDLKAGISGACFRTAELVRCDDALTDVRVDPQASRKLNARSMIAVPLCGRRSVIGLLEAFSTEAYGFADSDVKSLQLLAELILGAIKPEEEEQLESLSPVALRGVAIHGSLAAKGENKPEPTAPAAPQNPEPAQIAEPEHAPLPPEASTAEPAPTPKPKSIALEHPELGTLELQEVKISELFAMPEPAPPEPAVASAPVQTPLGPEANEPLPAIFSDYQKPEPASRPGVALVLAFVAIAAVAAAVIWWRLHVKAAVSASVAAPPPAILTPTKEEPKIEPAAVPLQESVPTDTSADVPPVPPVSPDDATRSVLPLVTGVRQWVANGSTTVVIDLQDQVQYEVHRLSSPERIYFDLHDTVLAPPLTGGKTIEVGDSLLLRIRIAQPVPGVTRVVLETRGVSNFSVSLEPNPYRLVAEIRSSAASAPSGGADILKPKAPADKKLTASDLPASIPQMKIVVDAGHGGWDLGTVGRKGLLEKDLVLDIAQRLGKLLEGKLGAQVIYTRTDDNYIPLEKRAELANDSQADLFVSVHANYSDYPSARGVETYYTNFSSPANTLDIEKRENATAKTAPGAPALTGVALKERTAESRHLAASVERSLYSTLAAQNPGIRDRGVKEAGFVVLTGTSMPAILAEVSFVSSPTDEKNLQSSAYRQQIAEALYKGVARYEASSSHVKLASASAKPTGK